jgi:hypothetical protein
MTTLSRPEFVVFYAWQSDRPASRTRYLIQEAAAEAAMQINADPSSPYNVRIDHDTLGVPGLCDIPATILEKIDKADGFLCDLTYVATTQPEKDSDDDFKERYCSNPNVLFELGYAFRSMGYQRLMCVMNENYGPAAKQIFDLAHRRFPFAYRMPNEGKPRSAVKAELATFLQTTIRQMFPLGRRADGLALDRVPEIRSRFESQARKGEFHGLVRRKGTIGIAVIPSRGKKYESHVLREQNLPPPGKNGWNTEVRGRAVLSVGTQDDERCAVTALHDDGLILGANSWVLDPAYHPEKELLVPAAAVESTIIAAVASYLKSLRVMEAALPWHICVSLLEIKDYWLLISDSETSRRPYPEVDIAPEPLVVRTVLDADSPLTVARLLRPAIDFIWREFGVDGSYNYTDAGDYTRRLFLR